MGSILITIAITVKWQKGDKVIKPSKYFRMTQDGETVSLHISEVFPEDEGMYKCLVSNAGGQAVLSANLKVIGKSLNIFPLEQNLLNLTIMFQYLKIKM